MCIASFSYHHIGHMALGDVCYKVCQCSVVHTFLFLNAQIFSLRMREHLIAKCRIEFLLMTIRSLVKEKYYRTDYLQDNTLEQIIKKKRLKNN